MDRIKLISYAYFYNGDYNAITKAIRDNINVPIKDDSRCITLFDKEYPKKLLELKYPPYVLFYKGDIRLLNSPSISVVGSRNASDYALRATKQLVINHNKDIIISGLAKGIDACAHEYSEKSIGVLGCGINYVYPICNKHLFDKLEKNGLIISEYPDKVLPLAFHFPFRNRIIACLGNTLYIMQSKINSGTMTSVNEALELGRQIKVLPYDVFSEYGRNNNHLIYEGAECIEYDEIAISK